MLQFVIFLGVSLALILVLKVASILMAERVIIRREELSPYECGFEHHNVSRLPFSLRYFILTLLFLLFDLEVIFLLFLPHSFLRGSVMISLVALLFVIFLYVSLVYE